MSDTTTMAEHAAALPAAFAANFGGRFQLTGFLPTTPLTGDAHLFVVIGQGEDDTYGNWLYNALSGVFGSGHIDLELTPALAMMIERTFSLRKPVSS